MLDHRFGKQGTLIVQELKSKQKPVMKTGTSPGSSTVMDVNSSTKIFAGGLSGQIKVSAATSLLPHMSIGDRLENPLGSPYLVLLHRNLQL